MLNIGDSSDDESVVENAVESMYHHSLELFDAFYAEFQKSEQKTDDNKKLLDLLFMMVSNTC